MWFTPTWQIKYENFIMGCRVACAHVMPCIACEKARVIWNYNCCAGIPKWFRRIALCIPTTHDFAGCCLVPRGLSFPRDKRAQRTKRRRLPASCSLPVARGSRSPFALGRSRHLRGRQPDFGVIRACCTYTAYKMVAFSKRQIIVFCSETSTGTYDFFI